MYARPTDRVEGYDDAVELLRTARFVQLVSHGAEGFAATGLPMVVDDDATHLAGHLARANPHWKELDGVEVLVVAPLSDGYVSPSWYRSKHADGGRVVPTWNYEVVHVHGTARIHDDADWLRNLVGRLTDTHESMRTDGGAPWAVSDAPMDFIDQQLRAIVGVSVEIQRIEAKRKLSGNRSLDDQRGVLTGLERTEQPSARLVASMAEAVGTRLDPR